MIEIRPEGNWLREADKKLKANEPDALLGNGWEKVRKKIPKGKFRVVYLDDMKDEAYILDDFDKINEAKDFCDIWADDLGKYDTIVIYNDKGEIICKKEGEK